MDKLQLTWSQYLDLVKQVGDHFEVEAGAGRFDYVLTIAKGGFVAATVLAYRFEIRQIFSVGMESYSETGEQKELVFYQELNQKQLDKLRESKFLIVDDIYDSGQTIEFLVGYFEKNNIGRQQFKIATVVSKRELNSNLDYFALQVSPSQWVDFPYE